MTSVDLSPLEEHHDVLFEIPLKVRQGHRFQPTGFADLGAAEFDTPEGRTLLVESAQSMANRFEAVCWDESKNELVEPLKGLSYVRVMHNGQYLTSSVTDSHRLNSPYILESKDTSFFNALKEELGAHAQGPIDRSALAKTLLKYDAGSLIHGVFLAKKELAGGRLRVARALTAFIEASNVKIAASGGAKVDHVDPTGKAYGGSAEKGFGNVPFPRDEYTAEKITLFTSLDLAQLRGYRLPEETVTQMLIVLCLYKLRAFIASPMRLRTACHFEVISPDEIKSTDKSGFLLPSLEALENELKKQIPLLAKEGCFADQEGVTTAQFTRGAAA